jgi:MarR family transcriptional regulator for hemolysin
MRFVSTLTNSAMPPPNINELGLVLFGTARAWRTKLDQRLRPLGLSQGKWRTLMHLSQGGDELTQKEIAERMGIEGPTLAGLLNRLQDDGWIERRGSAQDRRCKTVHLQRRSKAVLDRIFNTAHDLRTELIEDISQRDLETCMRVLTRIREQAEQPATNGTRNSHAHASKGASLS